METALALFTAGIASLAIVPLMMRLAPRLGMIDHPESRKVHAVPIPRVGGWGIAAGAVAAIVVWAPIDSLVLSYLWGVVVLFIFGALDDRREMGHYPKFVGQLVAVLPLVLVSGCYVTHFPFVDAGAIPPPLAMGFTVFALMGMTNAINHSDGLDGLAGGEAILSLVAIGFLAYLADGSVAVLIAVAVTGAVLGFLRYNTHPAVVFMGDSGSQVIGFSLGVLAIMLTQQVDTTLSPMVAVLFLGLPIADIIFVFYSRIREGRNWFLATKNHVHHRLLERRFLHAEAVVLIYAVQIGFVASGLLFRHESDWLLAGIYLGGCAVVFGGLHLAEKFDWYVPRQREERGAWRWLGRGKRKNFVLVALPRRFVEIAVPGYLVVASLAVPDVSQSQARAAIGLASVLGAALIAIENARSVVRRTLLFCAAAMVIYVNLGPSQDLPAWIGMVQHAFFGLLAGAVLVAIRYSPGRRGAMEFHTTSMDYLIILVLVVAFLATGPSFDASISSLGALFVMLYAIELIISERRERRHAMNAGAIVALLILAARGFL